jgi:NAD(P)-dependent dehydrogenase (short-subunit alcohol dehydrogenase family)
LALVTGGDRGIGRAISEMLAKEGYDIVIAARDKRAIASEVKRIDAFGAKAWGFVCDVTDKEQIKRLAKDATEQAGVPDILINNAGVATNKDFVSNTEEEIEEMVDVNLLGLMFCTRAFLPKMLERKTGIIVNISSGAGKAGFPGLAAYCATKFGVLGFTESLALEVEKKGVRVYAICPGATETQMYHALYPGESADFKPEDVAKEVLELVKNAAKIRPGSAIDVEKRV